uniref:Uncharacterized protein n=1 Tax=Anguilla anguilla TaxID=7936 RepID=A0A0E9VUF1_ANGAN
MQNSSILPLFNESNSTAKHHQIFNTYQQYKHEISTEEDIMLGSFLVNIMF